ncbi:MAG TPA: hypothetical protein DDW81_17415 [Cryomorphaceae bacterium]|nr:hypothetical protein [Owenweeksia sp.]HBF21883.1 hypothetical protein [Cryomorphaceae bacterium]|tara:strand:+ start:376 stop:699 length:324 start_codon:yes stop_codon:yes gene_type:complete
MRLRAKIKKIGSPRQIDTNFMVQSVIVETDEKKPQIFEIEFYNEKIKLLKSFSKGQEVLFHIKLKGKEWISPDHKAIYLVNFLAWRAEAINGQRKKVRPKSKSKRHI